MFVDVNLFTNTDTLYFIIPIMIESSSSSQINRWSQLKTIFLQKPTNKNLNCKET